MTKASEMQAATTYLEWQANPCGKPPLDLASTPRDVTFSHRVPSKMVMAQSPELLKGRNRRAALMNLEGSYHYDQAFPGKIGSYYEGPHPDSPETHVIIIYGEGDPWPLRDAPPRPAFMG